ncbi:hypothetical protein J1614_005349 [Plenodomus biglobosus]|nr:hypothetical protein J1614_005349 [Plenodomus biglobosus]
MLRVFPCFRRYGLAMSIGEELSILGNAGCWNRTIFAFMRRFSSRQMYAARSFGLLSPMTDVSRCSTLRIGALIATILHTLLHLGLLYVELLTGGRREAVPSLDGTGGKISQACTLRIPGFLHQYMNKARITKMRATIGIIASPIFALSVMVCSSAVDYYAGEAINVAATTGGGEWSISSVEDGNGDALSLFDVAASDLLDL